jgi:hypothetical protein
LNTSVPIIYWCITGHLQVIFWGFKKQYLFISCIWGWLGFAGWLPHSISLCLQILIRPRISWWLSHSPIALLLGKFKGQKIWKTSYSSLSLCSLFPSNTVASESLELFHVDLELQGMYVSGQREPGVSIFLFFWSIFKI